MPKKAPKAWWDAKEKEVKKSNPEYTDAQVRGTVGKIWWENMSEADRQKVLKKEKKSSGKVFLSKEAAQFKGLFSPKYEKWMVTEVELISQNNFGTWSSMEEAAANVDKAIKEISKTISSAVENEVKRIIDEHKEDIITDMSENIVAGPNLPQMGPSTTAAPTTEAVPAAPAKEEEPATLSPTPASKLSKVIKALSANASLTLNEAPEDIYKMKSNIDKMLENAGIKEFQAALDNGQYKFTFEDEHAAKVAHDVLDSEGFNVMLDGSGSINREQKEVEEEQLFDEVPQRQSKKASMSKKLASAFEESERKGDNFDSDLSQTEQAIDKALSENEDSLDQPAPNIKERTAQFEEDPSVLYLPEEFGEDINVGDIVEVSEGSGTLSGEQATVVPRSYVKTDGRGIPTNVPGAYQPVDWSKEVAIELQDGSIDLMFIDRLRKIGKKADKFDSDLTETKKNIDEALRENEDELDQPKPNIKERTAALELRPVGSNMTEVETDQVVVLFSYSTPVAYMDKASGQCFKTAEKFSTTTSRHINKWLEGRPAEEVDQSQIEGLVQTASTDTFSIESVDKDQAERILSRVVGQKVDLEEFKEDLQEEQDLEAKLETQDDMKGEVRVMPKKAGFMEPFIEEGTWVTIDGPMGGESCGADLVDMNDVERLKQEIEENGRASIKGTSLEDYFENGLGEGEIWSIEVQPGFSAYLSAPGYLDRTENVVFDTREEAEEYLKEMYPEEFEEEGEFEEVE